MKGDYDKAISESEVILNGKYGHVEKRFVLLAGYFGLCSAFLKGDQELILLTIERFCNYFKKIIGTSLNWDDSQIKYKTKQDLPKEEFDFIMALINGRKKTFYNSVVKDVERKRKRILENDEPFNLSIFTIKKLKEIAEDNGINITKRLKKDIIEELRLKLHENDVGAALHDVAKDRLNRIERIISNIIKENDEGAIVRIKIFYADYITKELVKSIYKNESLENLEIVKFLYEKTGLKPPKSFFISKCKEKIKQIFQSKSYSNNNTFMLNLNEMQEVIHLGKLRKGDIIINLSEYFPLKSSYYHPIELVELKRIMLLLDEAGITPSNEQLEVEFYKILKRDSINVFEILEFSQEWGNFRLNKQKIVKIFLNKFTSRYPIDLDEVKKVIEFLGPVELTDDEAIKLFLNLVQQGRIQDAVAGLSCFNKSVPKEVVLPFITNILPENPKKAYILSRQFDIPIDPVDVRKVMIYLINKIERDRDMKASVNILKSLKKHSGFMERDLLIKENISIPGNILELHPYSYKINMLDENDPAIVETFFNGFVPFINNQINLPENAKVASTPISLLVHVHNEHDDDKKDLKKQKGNNDEQNHGSNPNDLNPGANFFISRGSKTEGADYTLVSVHGNEYEQMEGSRLGELSISQGGINELIRGNVFILGEKMLKNNSLHYTGDEELRLILQDMLYKYVIMLKLVPIHLRGLYGCSKPLDDLLPYKRKIPPATLNLSSIQDGLSGDWWFRIITSSFTFQEISLNKNKLLINEGDILIHKEIKPGDRFPTTRYHNIVDKKPEEIEGKSVRDLLAQHLVTYYKKYKKLPPNCTFKKKFKNGSIQIVFSASKFDKFSLKLIPGTHTPEFINEIDNKYGIVA
ncbi:MAG: hypothetical protein ACTSUE_14785 [Promethearchaeota archaeon]